MVKNIGLIIISFFLVVLITIGVDRLAGRFLITPPPVGEMELIFPPHSENAFEMSDFSYTVHINNLGFRDKEVNLTAPHPYRIVAIGDSFTYGWGVEAEQAWPKQLEQRLAKDGHPVEVFNLGKPGAGPPYYAELAERALPILKPDLVVVACLHDDVSESMPDGKTPTGQRRYTYPAVRWVEKLYPTMFRLMQKKSSSGTPSHAPEKTTAQSNQQSYIDAAKRLLDQMNPEQKARFNALDEKVRTAFLTGRLNPYIFDISILKSPTYYQFLTHSEDPYIQQCIHSMGVQFQRIRQAAADIGAKVVVTPVPLGVFVNRESYQNVQRIGFSTDESMLNADGPDRSIQQAAQEANVPFVSVTDEFRKTVDQAGLYYELDNHFTPKGQAFFAELLTPLVQKFIKN